jgi:hypothetical protein
VSGEVVLVDSGDGAVLRLVRAAAALFAQPSFRPAALVGGLAVTMRLATAHRATNDVDTVADGDGPRQAALDYVTDRGEPGDRIEVDGVKVDVMPTWPLVADELPDEELPRLFVLAHRWALESAEPLTVQVTGWEGGPAEPLSLDVATAPALVACKFHALADRKEARAQKRESDALDLVRLVGSLVRVRVRVGGSAEPLAGSPFDLAELVAAESRRWFLDDATRMARLVRLGDGSADATVDPDDIAALGELFIERLRTDRSA